MRRCLPLLLSLLLAVPAAAEVSVIQDYCEQLVEGSDDVLIIHFSVVNFSLPAPLCDIHFIPEPQPAWTPCIVRDIVPAPGWSGFVNPFGGADFFANTIDACVDGPAMLGGFQIIVGNPDFCCYVVQFTDPTGAVMLEQEECFNCTLVPDETLSWGSIKSLYH